MKRDYEKLKNSLDLRDTAWKINPGGKFDGDEYTSRNPNREDSTLGSFRFNTSTGVWSDFATGDRGGDIIDFYAYCHNVTLAEAYDQLSGEINTTEEHKPRPKKQPTEIDYTRKPTKPKLSIPDLGDPNHIHEYFSPDGVVRFMVRRWDATETTKKEFRPLTWTIDGWKSKAPDKRPFYGVWDLKPTDTKIFVVEGEKCRDYLYNKYKYPVISASGGSNAVDKADWSSFPDFVKEIIYIPDNDEPGIKYCETIRNHLPHVKHKITVWPIGTPDKFDIADFIQNKLPFEKLMKTVVDFNDDEPPVIEPDYTEDLEPDYTPAQDYIEKPWSALGYDHESYFYWSMATQQIVELEAGQHAESNLLRFAPLGFWQENFPAPKRQTDWSAAKNMMMAECHNVGVFTPELQRGIGVWYDDGRIVVHCGSTLIVDGNRTKIRDHKSKYIYEAGAEKLKISDEFLSAEDSRVIQEIFNEFYWVKPIYAKFAVGWMVQAIIGGVMPWRAHAHIHGKSGSGKSYIMEVIKRLIGHSASLKGVSSEAGFRQYAGSNSIPVWWDEFECKKKSDFEHAENILKTMRTASTESDAKIVKGGQDGRPREFSLYCAVLMASINVAVTDEADATRVTLLELAKPPKGSADDFHELNKRIIEIVTPEFCERFRSRCIRLAKVIRENHKTLSRACGEHLGMRLGDQIGSLMAGAVAVQSDSIISLESARKWVAEQDWNDQYSILQGDGSEDILSVLMAHKVRLDSGRERTIGELIDLAGHPNDTEYDYVDDKISQSDAQNTLNRIGISVKNVDNMFIQVTVSDSHKGLRPVFEGTIFEKGWRHHILRLDGSSQVASAKFAGAFTRATRFFLNKHNKH